MEKYSLVLFFSIAAVGAYAQGFVAAREDVLAPPPSSIDLLRRSIQQSEGQPAASQVSAVLVTPAPEPIALPSAPAKTPQPAVQPSQEKNISAPAIPTETELAVEKNNALTKDVRAESEQKGVAAVPTVAKEAAPKSAEESVSVSSNKMAAIAQEELDYASRLMQQAKQEQAAGRPLPPPASQGEALPAPKTKTPFNPNDYRPGVVWQRTNSKNFVIYSQKRDGGIGSSNISMAFESAYATLRRNIPWMMSGKVRVFVYQDHNNYLKHEPNARAWTRALAYPTRGEVVVYDEPGKQQELKEVFTHELVHIFTQQFFDKYKSGRLMTPEWLDEGLAVYMEDQAYNGTKGGPWGKDLKTLNIQRSKESQPANFSSSSQGRAKSFAPAGARRKGKPVYFLPFDQFMKSGSLAAMEGQGKAELWYLQAYAMVRFLLNPAGGASPSNRMQFEQFTRLVAQGEQLRDPSSGFPVRGRDGKPVYQPYSVEKALGRVYRYNSVASFEDAFWRWFEALR